MKKTIHLGICMVLMFLYIYLTPLGAITLARTFGLGMDSYITVSYTHLTLPTTPYV